MADMINAGNIKNSAIALGDGAIAFNTRPVGLATANTELNRLLALLSERWSDVEAPDEIRGSLLDVQSELAKETPSIPLAKRVVQGVAASLAPVEALADIATKIVDLLGHVH